MLHAVKFLNLFKKDTLSTLANMRHIRKPEGLTDCDLKLLNIMIRHAKNKDIITNSLLVKEMGMLPHCLGRQLDKVLTYGFNKLGICLTVLIVNKDNVVHDKFYIRMAELLGIDNYKVLMTDSFKDSCLRAVFSIDPKALDSLLY